MYAEALPRSSTGPPTRSVGCGSPTPGDRPRWVPVAVTGRPRSSSPTPPSTRSRPRPRSARCPGPRNERSATAGLKTTSYAENVIALAHASERGATEAIFANTLGDLCEGTGSNVFYVVDGELRTPTPASGCPAGVTRAPVLEWCGGVEVDEPMSDVAERMSEAFLVSTTRDVRAISPLGRPRPTGPRPGHRGVCAHVGAARVRQPRPLILGG
ncbi:aminotransferase class IV [Nocardioides sp. B-3]|uniref:aminotransferase class IV n=1 Tax=Nocardioides sp. B-3 TaxID=2895565 RepID=UPI00300DD784